jgi:predicted secreted hydrolase
MGRGWGWGLLLLASTAFAAKPTEAPEPAPFSAMAKALDPTMAGMFKQAVPPYRFRFPRDHASHPEYQTEWWYYTGHLYSGSRKFGYELTFFQVGINPWRKSSRSAWALHTVYFAHFTVTDENNRKFQFTETISRPALGMAGSRTDRYRVWIHDWSAGLRPDNRTHQLRASAPEFAIDLSLLSAKPPVIHGHGGVSQKAAGKGRASHYYSLTRLETRGTLTLNGEKLLVTGLSWMDHEFGSNQLTEQQTGWDWFSLQLDDRRELMLYQLRLKDGRVEPLSSGTIVNADGTWKHLPLSAFQIRSGKTWKSPKTGATYPAEWSVQVPAEKLNLQIQPTLPDQELVTEDSGGVRYWEGSVRVTGQDQGKPVSGVGYVELTGYTREVPRI